MSSSLVVLVVDAYPADPPGDDRLHPANPHRPWTHHGPEVSRYVQREKKHQRWLLLRVGFLLNGLNFTTVFSGRVPPPWSSSAVLP